MKTFDTVIEWTMIGIAMVAVYGAIQVIIEVSKI